MRLQLTAFSMLILILFLHHLVSDLFPKGRIKSPGQKGALGGPFPGLYDTTLLSEALAVYLPFAAVALLMLSYGKPGLFPQWAGWACVILQVIRTLGALAGFRAIVKGAGILILVSLSYLWILQLPLFDPIPQ